MYTSKIAIGIKRGGEEMATNDTRTCTQTRGFADVSQLLHGGGGESMGSH